VLQYPSKKRMKRGTIHTTPKNLPQKTYPLKETYRERLKRVKAQEAGKEAGKETFARDLWGGYG